MTGLTVSGDTAAASAAMHRASGMIAIETETGAMHGMPRTSGIATLTQGAASTAGTAATGTDTGTATAAAPTGMGTAVGERMRRIAATCGRLRTGRRSWMPWCPKSQPLAVAMQKRTQACPAAR